jgi:hypothetical protein
MVGRKEEKVDMMAIDFFFLFSSSERGSDGFIHD